MFWRTSSAILSWLPQLQSHRGYWVKGLQQNSLVSVQEAYRLGYQIVEFDVRLTLDQEVVLFHDETFETNKLEQTNYEEFKRKIQHKYPQLSKLKDVLSWMVEKKQKKQDFNFKLNIEIKSKKIFDGRLEREVCHLIEKFNLSDRVLISSFNPFVLWRVRRKSP